MINRGYWNELTEQCKGCSHMKAMSLHMDGHHYYSCNKYPLKDSNETCPRFIKKSVD